MLTVFRAVENDEQEFLMMIVPGRITAPCNNSFVKPLENMDFGPRQVHFEPGGGVSQSFEPSFTDLVKEQVTKFYKKQYASNLVIEEYIR